jgi:RNA polymerase sigma-70 factor (ECF subfamily)
MSLPPEKLLAQAQEGDINAFHQLFRDFQPQLKSYLYRLSTDRTDADDLTHDTFVKAFDKISQFSGNSSLKTWVFSIGTNLAMDALRRRKPWPVDAQDQSRQASGQSPEVQQTYRHINQYSPDGTYEIREHIDFCFTCIAKTLPIEQQVSLLLKEVYKFRLKEITTILATTDGRVKHLLHAARQTMTDIFDARCSLVNQDGTCYQCTELNGFFNAKQQRQTRLLEIAPVQSGPHDTRNTLFELRTLLVSASGAELHDDSNKSPCYSIAGA